MNKKVKNAKQIVYKGVKYRSKLEYNAARCFEEAHITFQYEPFKLILLPTFKYLGTTYRQWTYTPDFVIFKNVIIEMKGYPNEVWPYKKKMILKNIINNGYKYEFYEVKSISELKKLIDTLKKHEKTK